MFYLDVVYVCNSYSSVFHVFLHEFEVHVSNVSAVSYVCRNCFIWMFQKLIGSVMHVAM